MFDLDKVVKELACIKEEMQIVRQLLTIIALHYDREDTEFIMKQLKIGCMKGKK